MAAFEFKKKIIALEFPDVKIELEYNSELRRKLTQVGESLQTIGKEAEANPDSGIAYLKSGIDSICGDGACDKIIGGRDRRRRSRYLPTSKAFCLPASDKYLYVAYRAPILIRWTMDGRYPRA